MDWMQAVDIYCERTAPGFWNEPANAVSNGAFVAGAIWAGVVARRRAVTTPMLWVLIALVGGIGVGSFLFHTFANVWSSMADTLPIWTFVALYILAAMHWLGGMAPARVARVAVIVIAVGLAIAWFAGMEGGGEVRAEPGPDPLNGSGQYAPALLALFAFSLVTWRNRHPYRGWVWGATGAFTLSLLFRTLDFRVCAAFPTGTHFLWHLMNAAMLTALLMLLTHTIADRRRA